MPKFVGLDSKQWLWVGGGLIALIVVYYVIKSRSGGAGVSAGGDLGGFGGGVGGSSPVSYAPGAPDTAGDSYQQQLNDLDIQARQEALREQQGMYELAQETNRQQLGLWGAQQNLLFQGMQQEQNIQLGYEQTQANLYNAQAGLANAQIGQVTKEVQSGKIKGECGKGESSYYDRNTGKFLCKKSGQSGAKAAADVVGNAILDWTKQAIPAYLTATTGYGGVPQQQPRQQPGAQQPTNAGNTSQVKKYFPELTEPIALPSISVPKATPYPQGARGDMEKFPTVTP